MKQVLPSNIAFKLDGVKFALLERSRKIPAKKFFLVVNLGYSSSVALNRMWTESSSGIVVNKLKATHRVPVKV